MNIEENNLETLSLIVRRLEKENEKLKKKLIEANIPFEDESENIIENEIEKENYDIAQGDRIENRFITEDMARKFFSIFWGREDMFAMRGKNGGYFLQCDNRWNNVCPKNSDKNYKCNECKNSKYTKLTLKKIMNHLCGYKEDSSDVIGIYPLLADNTCRFIVFDFDNHEKDEKNSPSNDNDINKLKEVMDEVNALRIVCKKNNIETLVERSRSGRGVHVWIIFKKPIAASKARNFGMLLLESGMNKVNFKNFKYYDRLFPMQDSSNGPGNLIALPLQGQALKNGNSAFVDENYNAYPDQWKYLFENVKKLTEEDIDKYIIKWKVELNSNNTLPGCININEKVEKPWRKKDGFIKSDVIGKLHIKLADGIYVETLNIMPRLQNKIRSMAAIDNPEYYKNKRLGYSNYNEYSALYLGKDIDGYIKLPRGLFEQVIEECKKADIEYDIVDERQKGKPIKVKFNGTLKTKQDLAAQKLLENSDGVLSAATAFGKTVVCSYLIGARKVNTLILLQSKDLLNQWIDELNKFLIIDEDLPTYETKTGRKKQRESCIGFLHGSKNALTGIIDVAMVGSMYSKGKFNEKINDYGMIIMDECHHVASQTGIELMQKIDAKYVYGVSATPKRGDNLDKFIFMLLGPMRHKFTAKERNEMQDMKHYFVPRFTRAVDSYESKTDINKAYNLISNSLNRNEMIIDDVKKSLENNQNPVILTKFKEHAKYFYDELKKEIKNVFILYGDNTDKENIEVVRRMKELPIDENVVLVATGQKIGEGFDYPRLDTLMLASPVSFEGRLTQYIGRISRDYKGKKAIYVYDYIDSHIKVFEKMYSKRLSTYKKIGLTLLDNSKEDNTILFEEDINSIYNYDNYIERFEQDIISAKDKIVIASPNIIEEKINRILELTKTLLEKNVKITIVTSMPDSLMFGNSEVCYELIYKLRNSGIHVVEKDDFYECYAVIDNDIVWHGGINLLGKEDIFNNLIRIKDNKIAEELLEITFGNIK